MPIADTPLEAITLTSLWAGSLLVAFVLGLVLERGRTKKRSAGGP